MKQRKRKAIIITVLLLSLVFAGGIYSQSTATIRTVDFLSIFAIGALTGLLISQVVGLLGSDR